MTPLEKKPAATNASPSQSVLTLMAQIIDYAGLFPPAGLDMATVVRNYAAYTQGDDASMLGRLIVPVARLEEFEQCAGSLLPRGHEDEPWHLSGLTAPAGDSALVGQLERIEAFNQAHEVPASGLARIDVLELKADGAEVIEAALDEIPDALFPFFELPITADPRGLLAALVGSDAGAKVRTGGVAADLYPDPGHLARFIAACAAARVPFKATAGLHHPLRHFSQAVQAHEFGFLNVFVAAALSMHGEFDTSQLLSVLTDERIESFGFDDEGIAWRGEMVTVDQLERSRELLAISFGSCSFDEPLADLRSLHLL